MKITDSKKISTYLYDKLTDSDWKRLLNSFVNSNDFSSIIEELIDAVDSGDRFSPPLKDIFNPFKYCSYNDLKVVFLKKEPYIGLQHNDGLAFSCNDGDSKSFPLRVITNVINKTVYTNGDKKIADFTSELKIWAEQGVLLLNGAFTSDYEHDNIYLDLWRPFTTYLLDSLQSKKGIIYVLFGDYPQEYEYLINKKDNYILNVGEVLDYSWEDNDMFNTINWILNNKNENEIIW